MLYEVITDLIAAPVVNAHGQPVGHLPVEAVLDYVHASSQRDLLAQAGLREEEDLFAPIWHSGRNRWPWLGLNLLIAFAASRIIGQFEYTITHLVALAALLPIAASVGGNTGNQTLALVIRGRITSYNVCYTKLLRMQCHSMYDD